MNRCLIAVGIVILVSISTSQSPRQNESLRGLNGVYVYIQPVAKEAEAGGLSTLQIQNAVEKQFSSGRLS